MFPPFHTHRGRIRPPQSPAARFLQLAAQRAVDAGSPSRYLPSLFLLEGLADWGSGAGEPDVATTRPATWQEGIV